MKKVAIFVVVLVLMILTLSVCFLYSLNYKNVNTTMSFTEMSNEIDVDEIDIYNDNRLKIVEMLKSTNYQGLNVFEALGVMAKSTNADMCGFSCNVSEQDNPNGLIMGTLYVFSPEEIYFKAYYWGTSKLQKGIEITYFKLTNTKDISKDIDCFTKLENYNVFTASVKTMFADFIYNKKVKIVAIVCILINSICGYLIIYKIKSVSKKTAK